MMNESCEYKVPNAFIRLDRQLVESPAWFSLSGTSMKVLVLFWLKARIETKGRKRYIANNGHLRLTYEEVRERYGIFPARFKRALSELIEKGFLEVTRQGQGRFKRASEYAISWRWKGWGKPGFRTIRMKENPPPAGFNKLKKAKPARAKPVVLKKKPKPVTNKINGRNKDNGKWITVGRAINRLEEIDCQAARDVANWHIKDTLADNGIKTKLENREILIRIDTLPVRIN